MATTLTTTRLTLRHFRASDLDAYAEICADPEVMRHVAAGQPLSRQDAWRQMAMFLGHWELLGYGMWAVEERATGRLLGRVGFLNPDGWPGFEIGWALGRAFWKQGFATEAARAALDHAFSELDQPHVISLMYPENTPSIRVAQRLGETLEREMDIFGKRVLVYGIHAPEHRAGGPLTRTEPGTGVTIAPAGRGDVRVLARMIHEMDRHYGESVGYSLAQAVHAVHSHLVDCPGRGALLARTGADAVGMVIYAAPWPTVDLKPALFLKDIFVREHARREGVGRALLGELAAMALRDGYSRIDWTADRANTTAQAVYQALGIPVLEHKLFYRLEGLDLQRLARRE